MSLHGLLSVTIGVPNVEETAAYYAEFGLTPQPAGWFSTVDAGRAAPGRARAHPPPPRTARRRRPRSCTPGNLAAMMTGAHSAR
jgi:hypothetical protein